jgi:hemerythrin-like metal-binding protein
MHRFELAPNSSTGHVDIDGQLGTLFSLANEVLFGDVREQSHIEFRHAVSFFFSYLEYHFASEELAMAKHGYSSRRFHAAFHDHVRREAQSIGSRLGRAASIEEVRSAIFFLIEDWAVYHVERADRQLADYLHEQSPTGGTARLPGFHPLDGAPNPAAADDPGLRKDTRPSRDVHLEKGHRAQSASREAGPAAAAGEGGTRRALLAEGRGSPLPRS